MVSDYKITMEQAEYEMVCYRRVFNFVRLLDQEKLEKLNAEGLLAAEGGQTKKADLCIGHFCQGCVAMEAFLRKAELCKLESGDGFADILAEPEDPDAGIVIELKYSQTFSGLQNACERALAQIREKRYDERLRNEGRNNILAYGVAFCKKRCKVAVQRL